ncbi:MAG TPA: hypothetical protein VFT56_01095 [Sphingomonas sp.]|nr:hypothetical protein [Sphingomonas sp.]
MMLLPLIAIGLVPQASSVTRPVHVVQQADAMTDDKIIAAVAETLKGDQAISVVCSPADQYLQVVFQTPDYLGADPHWNRQEISYRFDRRPAVTATWNMERHAAHLENTKLVTAFIREMMSAKRILLRVTDYSGEDHDYSFDLTQAKPAIAEVVRACGDTKVAQALAADLAAD